MDNKFEQARAMAESPKRFLAELVNDERMRENKRLMQLVREILAGFKRYAGYAVLSGLKGLNPFRKESDMVELGYYDYRKTTEYQQAMARVAAELGISEEYLHEVNLEKYQILKEYLQEGENPVWEEVKDVALMPNGLFAVERESGTSILHVADELTYQEFVDFLAGSEEYKNLGIDTIASDPVHGYRIINAQTDAYKAFQELHGGVIGRATEAETSPTQEEQTQEDEAHKSTKERAGGKETDDREREINEAENNETAEKAEEKTGRMIFTRDFVFEKQGEGVLLKRYRGQEGKVALPSVVEADGRKYPVVGVWEKAFIGSHARQVWVDARAINPSEWDPMAARSGERTFLEVHWTNLTPEMQSRLKENQKWAGREMRHPTNDRELGMIEGRVKEAFRGIRGRRHPFFRSRKSPDVAQKTASEPPRTQPETPERVPAARKKDKGMDI